MYIHLQYNMIQGFYGHNFIEIIHIIIINMRPGFYLEKTEKLMILDTNYLVNRIRFNSKILVYLYNLYYLKFVLEYECSLLISI